MRATDLIRSVLELIDSVDQPQEPVEELPTLKHDGDIEGTPCGDGPESGDQVANRFKTIYDIIVQEKPTPWATIPN